MGWINDVTGGDCCGSPPPAPDYMGLAQQQGQNNIDMAKMQQPNVISPYGTQTVTYGGTPQQTQANFDAQAYLNANPDVAQAISRGGPNDVTSAWQHYQNYGMGEGRKFTMLPTAQGNIPTVTQTLSPAQQGLLDQQNKMKGLLGGLGIQGAQSLQGIVGRPLDLSGLPDAPKDSQTLRDQAYQAAMGRVNEDAAYNRDEANSNLVAAGFHPGSKGYDQRMNIVNRGVNDARNVAMLNSGNMAQQSFNMDAANRSRGLAEMLAQRQTPLNEINALMSGSQVSNPFTMPGAGGVNAQPAPLFQAGQLAGGYGTDVYNAGMAQNTAAMGGLFGLAGAGIGALGSYLGSPGGR